MKYKPVIGLEVHVELNTNSKMFCGCDATYFGKEPNTHTCPVCLGLPGALPVPNRKAIVSCVSIGLALNCKIPNFSKFDRKNYFYPDLAKGYQISQYDKPFCIEGHITLSNGKKIGITRAHMEEDTAKLTHAEVDGKKVSLVDFNRSGVPLVEIVTEPDFETAEEVVEYLKKLQQIVRFLGVSNADMEKGDMRLEPNISLRKNGEEGLPKYKVEVKNINSFRFVGKAIEFEIKRQSEILDKGEIPAQETRGWNEVKNGTVSQRSKEEAHDYRYFPEPDIPPIVWEGWELEQIKKNLPQLPDEKLKNFVKDYGLTEKTALVLVSNLQICTLFEGSAKLAIEEKVDPTEVANYIANQKLDLSKISPDEIVEAVKEKKSGKIEDEEELEKIAQEVIAENEKSANDFKSGKDSAIQSLIGGVMRKTQGKADASIARKVLEGLLK